jgi:mannose-6-phosphate isomerase-like protein (cupin superfamily)
MDKGFGDTFERFTKTTGIKRLIITVTGWFGVNCGCKKRQDILNKWFPYKKKKKMNKKITLEDILDPVSPKVFFKEYWGKKHLVIRRNKFRNLYTWQDFNRHMNMYPDIKALQIVNWKDGNGYDESGKLLGRWCLDKVRSGKVKTDMLTKRDIWHEWAKHKRTFVIPFADYQKEDLIKICHAFEQYFGHGQVNVYASPAEGSKSFPTHSDGTENFLFHTEGKTKWTMYDGFAPGGPGEILDEFVLEPGDLLYIPTYQYHSVTTVGPRMLLSIHFKNKKEQSLNNFRITNLEDSKRKKWYDWKPERFYKKDGTKIIERIDPKWRMKSNSWKEKYFK